MVELSEPSTNSDVALSREVYSITQFWNRVKDLKKGTLDAHSTLIINKKYLINLLALCSPLYCMPLLYAQNQVG